MREVEEETGLRCELGRELPSTSYHDSKGRPKTVRYWEMRPLGGDFRPHREVDEIRWLSVDAAKELLSHRPRPRRAAGIRDGRALMALLLLRHGTAGHRKPGVDEAEDRLRPLDERGRRQAEALPPSTRASASSACSRARTFAAYSPSSRSLTPSASRSRSGPSWRRGPPRPSCGHSSPRSRRRRPSSARTATSSSCSSARSRRRARPGSSTSEPRRRPHPPRVPPSALP